MPRTSSVAAGLAELGQFIRDRRTALGLTQAQVAAQLGWGQERVSTLEHARYGMPSVPVLASLADALNCPLADILAAAGFPVVDRLLDDLPVGNRAAYEARLYALQRLLHIDAIEPGEALSQASTIIEDVMGADKVDVFLLDEATCTLVAVGASDTPMGRREREAGLDRLPLAAGGSTARVFETGETYSTGCADRDPDALLQIAEVLGVRSVVEVPLAVEGITRGVVSVNSAEPDRFSEEDRRFAEAVSGWVAIILHRAQLIDRLESHGDGEG